MPSLASLSLSILEGAWAGLLEGGSGRPAGAGTVVDGEYENAFGRREYQLFVPSGYAGQPVPLLVLLHGCTQDPADIALGTGFHQLAERDTFLVVAPAQPRSANLRACWNWFDPRHQERGAGEPSLIAGIVGQVRTDYRVDPGHVYVAGMSAGGAMAALVAAAYPDVFAAVGIHSGLAYRAAGSLASALDAIERGAPEVPALDPARRVPAIVFHGDADRRVHPVNAHQIAAQWMGRPLRAIAAVRGALRPPSAPGARPATVTRFREASRRVLLESWMVHGLGHAWSGGSPTGSHTDPSGPDAAAEMVRFFRAHALSGRGRAAAGNVPVRSQQPASQTRRFSRAA